MTAGKYESYVRQSEFFASRLLREEFCSQPWLKAAFVKRSDREGRKFVCRRRGIYPVTGMVRCAQCRVWVPSYGLDPLCPTCRVDIEEEKFRARARCWPKEIRLELFRRHWRNATSTRRWLKEGMPMSLADVTYAVLTSEEREGSDSPVDEADLFGGSLESDQRWGHGPSSRDLAVELQNRFYEEYKTKKGKKRQRVKRHGGGCVKRLLPETKKVLRLEIKFYDEKGLILPWARRVSNPFDKFERPLAMPGKEGLQL